ncbi:betaine-aldehyde dehydrogenase [Pseudohoeflea coraliihabitans]|uniref:Betaine aldehyde dehydrogenase n=1 Tax=Pseudohoeflea coraliihabitans TaxID=2860393 RepID=A0ABS6WRK9_9HYPH|nr:betaine-aldehyde dehydrogenase [Pseudohoeflea sp. DP4N28-3]MBW3098603.1 betaine-aldehyde dehydrogenase [Pseudohoeflea sp. DP4N28-3]
MQAQPRASHHINGQFHETPDGAPLDVSYPATGDIIARLHAATPELVDRVVAEARAAQKGWARLTGSERGRVLRRAADLIRARNAEISRIETLDTGKALQETLVADAASAADCLEYFGGIAAAITGETVNLGDDFVYTRREPLGVCAGIGAWNYPMQIAAWKAAPALAAGNAFIFKPSEMTPLTALILAEILCEAGLPNGVFNVIQGFGDIGAALAAHPGIDKISLTGSVPTGSKVMGAAATTLKDVTMELGGKSPLIVFADADLEDAIGGAMLGNFYSTGQICSNGTRVFVEKPVYERFVERLQTRTEKIRIGDPLDPDTQMGPLISMAQRDKVLDYIASGQREGARLITGGTPLELQGFAGGAFIAPTVFADVTDDMTIAREEIFGPVMAVLPFAEESEVIDRANATPYGLAAGVFTRDLARAHRVIAALDAGTTWINTYNLTPVEAPFGGVKRSGIGRENSMAAINHYTRLKSVYVASGPVDSPY